MCSQALQLHRGGNWRSGAPNAASPEWAMAIAIAPVYGSFEDCSP